MAALTLKSQELPKVIKTQSPYIPDENKRHNKYFLCTEVFQYTFKNLMPPQSLASSSGPRVASGPFSMGFSLVFSWPQFPYVRGSLQLHNFSRD